MDEAEYCGRVGIMRAGKLLSMASPSELKSSALPGLAWDIYAEPLMPALAALERCSCVFRAGLAGDHLRAITSPDAERNIGEMQAALQEIGARDIRLEPVEPTLEDVFLALAEQKD